MHIMYDFRTNQYKMETELGCIFLSVCIGFCYLTERLIQMNRQDVVDI
jgi:hypothetical protein